MERTVTVAILEGLHARPAALFVQEASRQPASVTLTAPEADPVDADSILGVMTLGVTSGMQVVLSTDDDDADARASIDALATFLAQETIL